MGLVGCGCAPLDGGHDNYMVFKKQVIKDPVVADAPAPRRRLQAFDVPAERVRLKGVEGTFNAKLILAGKARDCLSCAFGDEQLPVHREVWRG